MKKVVSWLLSAVLICTSFSFMVSAADSLPEIIGSDVKTLPFSDVSVSDWFYKSVFYAKQHEIMEGVSSSSFSPNSNLTVAQAVTLASRLHAQYHKKEIPVSAAHWYDPYIAYAKNNNLLPPAYADLADPDHHFATRFEAAYLFYSVLKDVETTQTISDLTIKDFSSCPAEYRTAVTTMYHAGIITGMSDGTFSGESIFTRAQAATIIMRILDKTQRASHDSRYNYEFLGQEGNQDTYSYSSKHLNHVAYNDFYSFYVIYDAISGNYAIIKRDRAKATNDVLYVGNGHVHDMIVRNGYLYFQEDLRQTFDQGTMIVHSYINRILLNSNKFECLFESDKYNQIFNYELYDEKLFAVEYYTTQEIFKKITEIDLLSGKKQQLPLPENLNVSRVDAYNKKLYFEAYNSNDFNSYGLYEYDLATSTTTLLIQKNIGSRVALNNHYNVVEDNLYSLVDEEGIGNGISLYRYNLSLGKKCQDEGERLLYLSGNKYNIWQIVCSEGAIYFVVQGNGEQSKSGLYKLQPNGTAVLTKQVPYRIAYLEFDYKSNPLVFHDFGTSLLGCYDLGNGIVLENPGFFSFTKESYAAAIKSTLGGEGVIPYYIPIYSEHDQNSIKLANASGISKHVKYDWSYGNGIWSWSLDIDTGLYEKYKGINRMDHLLDDWYDYAYYAKNPDDDFYMNQLATCFKNAKNENGFTDAQMAQLIASFVQNITYKTDRVSTGFDEYPKFPVETLFEKEGDCEDTSILLASLYNEIGLDAVLVMLPEHMAVAVKCDGLTGAYYDYNGSKYYYIETTNPGWRIGEVPKDILNDTATILPAK